MKIKQLLFLGLTLLLFNCEVEFDRNVRVESLGKVVDENNNAMSGVSVVVSASTEAFQGFFLFPFSSLGDNYILNEGLTNSEGNFSITSLFDSDQNFSVFIDGQTTHTDYLYFANSSGLQPESFMFNLGNVTLKRKAQVNVNISRSSPPETTFNFFITYQNNFCREIYTNGVLDQNSSNCFEEELISRDLDAENPEFTTTLNSFITGTVEFGYSINGGSQTIEIFTINEDNYDINFSY